MSHIPALSVLIAITATAAIADPAPSVTLPTNHPPCTSPISVIDGDTVEGCGIRWRLDGIDTPEINHARCADERHKGIKAAARLMELLTQRGGQIVPTINRRDRVATGGFGRKLGRLVFGDGSVWTDVAIAEGHAVAYLYRKQPLPTWCGPAA